MKNGNIDVFLDYGWEHDTGIFYNGFYYYLSGGFGDDKKFYFNVFRVRGFMEDDQLYCKQYKYNGKFIEEEELFQEALEDKDLVKKHFIEAKIFDGKSFWEVESELTWVEDGGEFVIKSLNEIKH